MDIYELTDRLKGITDQARCFRNLLINKKNIKPEEIKKYIIVLKEMVDSIKDSNYGT